MTLEEFLAALAETRSVYDWRTGRRSAIRAYQGSSLRCFCPLTAVVYHRHGTVFNVSQFAEAAQILGISRDLADTIVFAADGDSNQVRQQLLAALSLD